MSKYTRVFNNDDIVVEVDSKGNYRVSFYKDDKWQEEHFFFKERTKVFDFEPCEEETPGLSKGAEKVFDFYRKNKPAPNGTEVDNEDFYDELDKEADKAFKEVRKRNNTTTTGTPSTEDSILKGWLKSFNSTESYIPKCCRGCPNHSSNGGSGICNCTAPLFDPENPNKITC